MRAANPPIFVKPKWMELFESEKDQSIQNLEDFDWMKELKRPAIPTYEDIERTAKLYMESSPASFNAMLIYQYKADPFEPSLTVKAEIDIFEAINAKIFQIHKKRLFANLVNKVQEYYEDKFKEDNNMTIKENEALYKLQRDIIDIGGAMSVITNPCFLQPSGVVKIEIPLSKIDRFQVVNGGKAKPYPEWIDGLPAVKKVETYNNRVVKVMFIDGTFTKSVCSENDNFSLDVGITICLMKRLLGPDGHKIYNKIMKQVHKAMDWNEAEKESARLAKEADKARKRKAELKKAAKKLKAREEQIDIQKQAILRAMIEREDDLK